MQQFDLELSYKHLHLTVNSTKGYGYFGTNIFPIEGA
jgi:hypothetical protein